MATIGMDNKKICFGFFLILLLDGAYGLFLSPEKATMFIGEPLAVVCKDASGRVVTWTGPKGVLNGRTRPQVKVFSYGTSLFFNNTILEDSGTYTCNVGNEEKQFHLQLAEPQNENESNNDNEAVIDPPDTSHTYHHHHKQNKNYHKTKLHNTDSDSKVPLTFMDTKSEQIGKEGQNVVLKCEVKGGEITWSVEGDEPLTEDRFKLLGDGLLIRNASRTDSKTYICKALQQATGDIQEKKIKLTIEHKPSLKPVYASQEQTWGYLGGTVNLTCEVEAEPPPKFEWKNKLKRKPDMTLYDVSSHMSVLQINVNKKVFGDYTCIASNSLGSIEKHFTLEQGTKPNSPDYLELRGVNSDLLDLGIHGPEPTEDEIKEGMEPKGYNVLIRNINEYNWSSREFNKSKEESYPIRGLEVETEYEVKAATRNFAGLSEYTNSSFFKTLASGASNPSTPTTLLSLFYFTILSFSWNQV